VLSRSVLWSVGVVGTLLVVLNVAHLTFGFARLQHALATEPIPTRLAEPLKIAWVYIGSVTLLLGGLLLWLLPDLAAGSAGAWKAAVGLGLTLVGVGIASFLATGRHPGLLFFCLLGIALLAPLLLARPSFQR
jgi:hypothetical protein